MPVPLTYPGVYIEEIPSGVRTITGVATSITAFIGRALKGRIDEPIRVQSFGEFERQFGGLWLKGTMSYAVQHFFQNGGQDALIVRVDNGGEVSKVNLGGLILEASSPGAWGKNLRAKIDHNTSNPDDPTLFNLMIEELETRGTNKVVATETLRNLSTDLDARRFYKTVIAQEAVLVNAADSSNLEERPTAISDFEAFSEEGNDGNEITDSQIASESLRRDRKGLYALEKTDLFNLLCIPPLTRALDVTPDVTLAAAVKYCQDKRALLIVDPPSGWKTISQAVAGMNQLRSDLGGEALARNAAVFFPRLKMADPLQENRTQEFAPCGAIAGIFTRTDVNRGVWKAPAGTEAGLLGVRELGYKMTDGENGQLNPLGLNCIRSFPTYGNVVWGSRTAAGADRLASEWKYVPVRRMALFLEESLYRGTQWVVFEPNDEPLWAQIRLNIGAFMNNLFRQGAFQGKTPREAYLVKCDKETTTQNDINLGIVNIVVGFAPLKPAEFVIIKLQQLAGQIEV
ncbi:phage tail sheath C-terminal domain-containing protein [Leptolyngbya sp. FACHB-17]|uniref:phage tail sheath family protein n=1 Tax=unclassified Leptolyngbya TaxID=2650499 RepID=UPI001681592C|nr:phage tail sheath C-terminal domain-containing protein [Leptolyngbya sp. FACHB-17]MBD2080940.1 phage tail sheath family protein [Leptolyngbya sp. FACHB-17]